MLGVLEVLVRLEGWSYANSGLEFMVSKVLMDEMLGNE